MNISIGIYELFAYTIPGVIYIYVINEFLRLIHYPYVDINKLENLAQLAIIAVLAYIAGHIFDSIAQKIWVPLLLHADVPGKMLALAKEKNKELKLQFTVSQAHLLRSALRRHNMNIVDRLSKHDVLYIMLRNVSFGLLLFAILQFFYFWQTGWALQYLIVALASLGVSIIAIRRSQQFRERYYQALFDASISYGNSLEQILQLPPSSPDQLPPPPQPDLSPYTNVR